MVGPFRNRRSRSIVRSRPYGSGGLATLGAAARMALGAYPRRNTNSRSQNFANPAPITGESDWRRTYRRKRMPRRRRRRWVRFSRKVRHIILKQVAPQFNVVLRQENVTSLSGQQGSSHVHTILGAAGDGFTSDISFLTDRALELAITNGVSPAKDNLRIHVSGWMAETQITNNLTYPIYVDCYYWKAKRDLPNGINSVESLWEESLADVAAQLASVPPAITPLSTNDYGVTPFQGTQFAKTVRVWKKIRVKLAGGSTTQIEQRSGRDYRRSWSFDEHYSLVRNCTEGILFVQYGTPSNSVIEGDGIARATDLSYSTNINYTWRMVQDNRMTGMHVDQ